MKRKKALVRKGKKKWFTVKSPEIFNSKEIGNVSSYTPNELVGRVVNMPLKEITKSRRDSSTNIGLKISKVRGETVETEPVMYEVQGAYVGRIERKSKKKIITVVDPKTKDGRKVRIKVYALLNKKVSRVIRTSIHNLISDEVSKFAKSKNCEDVFSPITVKTLAIKLKKIIKNIYPATIIIWKIKRF